MNPVRREFLRWTRSLHIYLSVFALLAMLFFAVTGFILNHPDWFDLSEGRTISVQASAPREVLEDRLLLVEHLRAAHGVTGLMDAYEDDGDTVRVVFKSPGRVVDVSIERNTGNVVLQTESWGLLGRLADLHKGKHSGTAWGLVIDLTSIFLVLVGTTGLILWLTLRRRLVIGMALGLTSVALICLVYFLWVP